MDESTLLKGCLRNDRRAQHALYRQYAAEMLGVCYRYTKQATDAEDVLQEGFVKVFTRLQQYSGKGSFGGWIRKVMVSTALDFLRRNKNYKSQLYPADELPETGEVATPILMQNAGEVVELIRELPLGYQTVFNLVGIEGYEHQEVAEMLGISVQTSRSQYHRARNMLVKKLNSLAVSKADLPK
jgi:RNA polymerase sigma-70 factor (ECF subfamily)